jgi:ParB family chromosome partitioning protein
MALLAHCTSLTVNAVKQPGQTAQRTQAAADKLASALGLDMAAHWSATEASYLGRVTKPHILAAVTEAAGAKAAKRIATFKKPAMAEAAANMLAGKGWLPAPLKTYATEEDEALTAATV